MESVGSLMPKVNIRKEIFEELHDGSSDVTERINEIVQGYLRSMKKYEHPYAGDPDFREYFIHGNAD